MWLRTLGLIAALGFVVSCGGEGEGDGEAGAKDLVGGLKDKAGEMGDMGADKVNETIDTLVSKMDEIKDAAGATAAADQLKGMVDTLATAKTTLGDKMPDMSKLTDAVASLKEKFAGNDAVMTALKPVLDAITNLKS